MLIQELSPDQKQEMQDVRFARDPREAEIEEILIEERKRAQANPDDSPCCDRCFRDEYFCGVSKPPEQYRKMIFLKENFTKRVNWRSHKEEWEFYRDWNCPVCGGGTTVFFVQDSGTTIFGEEKSPYKNKAKPTENFIIKDLEKRGFVPLIRDKLYVKYSGKKSKVTRQPLFEIEKRCGCGRFVEKKDCQIDPQNTKVFGFKCGICNKTTGFDFREFMSASLMPPTFQDFFKLSDKPV